MKRLLTLAFALISIGASAYRTDTLKVHSAIMDKDIDAIVVVPDKAFSEACPSVYLLHGHAGSFKFWPSIRRDIGQMADQWGFIFVCPDAGNSWYIDSPVKKDSQYESFMTRELVPFVDSRYNTIANRNRRAVSGLSMGGHGALFLAMRHPDIWGSAGSMSGCPDIRLHPNNWNLEDVLGNYANNSQRWDAVCVVNQIKRIRNGELAIIIDCGEDDFMLEMNKDLHTRLLGAGIDHDFTTRPGTHWFNYWQNAIDYQLLFHYKFFNKTDIR
ncbi:MAG: esterase family protein [Bacteroidales bacterium]|nr:esterase family protein [Bacteroidales bacterium]